MWEQCCWVWISVLSGKGEHQTETEFIIVPKTRWKAAIFLWIGKQRQTVVCLRGCHGLLGPRWNPIFSLTSFDCCGLGFYNRSTETVFLCIHLSCDYTLTIAIVWPKHSPWEQLTMYESLCIEGNMRGFRGRSHPQTNPSSTASLLLEPVSYSVTE